MDWFLYDNGLRHERVNLRKESFLTITKDHFIVSNKNEIFIPKQVFYFFMDVFGILNRFRNSFRNRIL